MQAKMELLQPIKSKFVRAINGVTFIDAVALESVITNLNVKAVKNHLRQKMIHVGVEFGMKKRLLSKNR
jgi:hypothetical protein